MSRHPYFITPSTDGTVVVVEVEELYRATSCTKTPLVKSPSFESSSTTFRGSA
ncbi:hypothetical protein OA328_00940 [Paracoccaceae bacterium]|nr:hypothetical protein [Paracoccaceae bacterium]